MNKKCEVIGIESDKEIISHYYRFFNIDILLKSDSIDILNKIRGFFPHFYARLDIDLKKNPDHTYQIYSKNNNFKFYDNDNFVYATDNLKNLLMNAEFTIFDNVVKQLDYVVLHAAMVSFKNDGILFAGLPRIGKTTLTIGLVKRGFRYLTDDLALIDEKTLKIMLFPKAMSIREKTMEIFDEIKGKIDRDDYYLESGQNKKWFMNIQDIFPDFIGEPCNVGYILFPTLDLEREPELVEISKAQAVIELMKFSFRVNIEFEKTLDILTKLVECTKGCYTLSVGKDLEKTLRLVERIVFERYE